MPHRRYRIEDTVASPRRGQGTVGFRQAGDGAAMSYIPLAAAGGMFRMSGDPRDREAVGLRADLADLGRELLAMQAAIATTKREVATLQRSETGRPGVHRAASELDAVAIATEHATTTILGAVEEIEATSGTLKASAGGDARSDAIAQAITERVLVLYEACNFQDVAGQRIKKVVATLKFVEEGLDRVLAAWGDAMPAGPRREGQPLPRRHDGPVAQGPSLPGEAGAVTQSEVDALFV